MASIAAAQPSLCGEQVVTGDPDAYDGTIRFYSMVRSLVPTGGLDILDFGAGRGQWTDDPHQRRRGLHDLRDLGKVTACDIDPVVLTNTGAHQTALISPDGKLPFDDASFDLIVCDWTFEHIEDANGCAAELKRITCSGGWICARTPSKWAYSSIATRLIPNTLHARVLSWVQPERVERDIFPTRYRLNSRADVARAFSNCDVHATGILTEPGYDFGSRLVYAAMMHVHRILPGWMLPSAAFLIRKH